MRRQVSRQLGSTLCPLGTKTVVAVGYLVTAEMVHLGAFSLLQLPLGITVESQTDGTVSINNNNDNRQHFLLDHVSCSAETL